MTAPVSFVDLANALGPAVKRAAVEARATTDEQRALVLRHPDLAAKLTEPPLGYVRPDQWGGYIPPKWMLAPHENTWIANDSAQRRALVAIYTEAIMRSEANDG